MEKSMLKITMKRRTVRTIKAYLAPNEIFKLITSKSYGYAPPLREFYECRDRAYMAMSFGSAGRVTEILGGPRYIIENSCLECKGNVERTRVKEGYRWICDKCGVDYGSRKPNEFGELTIIGEHTGLTQQSFIMQPDRIIVTQMEVVKRKRDTIEKYGESVSKRDDFIFPLARGLYEKEFGDQLVPFSWLIKEFVERFKTDANLDSKFFGFRRGRGWQIIREVTGQYPNWFRAQAEHFYGNYLIHDSVLLSKFVKVVNPGQVATYIGFGYDSLLKDKQHSMDFTWIDPAIEEIKERIK